MVTFKGVIAGEGEDTTFVKIQSLSHGLNQYFLEFHLNGAYRTFLICKEKKIF